MKLDQVVALIVRFFVIYLFFFIIVEDAMMLANFAETFWQSSHAGTFIYLAGLTAILVAMWLLWKYPLFVAKKIIPEGEGPTVKISLSFDALQTLCFTVLGFWLTLNGTALFVHDILMYGYVHARNTAADFDNTIIHTTDYRFWTNISRIVIGIFAMLGAKSVVKILKTLRGEKQ